MFDVQQSSTPGSTEPAGSPEKTASGNGKDPSTKDAAMEEARGVAQEGLQAGKHVASVAADQARDVVSEAGTQAQGLLAEAKSELLEQAASQKNRVADQLHTLATEFGSMASKSDQDGLASGLAEQASRQTGTLAQWLSEREPGSLVGELKDFARARPGTFLAVAAGIGLVAGRMTRGAQTGPADQLAPPAPTARPAVGSPVAPSVVVSEPPSPEGVPDLAAADPGVGAGALRSDMVSDEPLPSGAPGMAR
jgi:uncharacterized membrane protein